MFDVRASPAARGITALGKTGRGEHVRSNAASANSDGSAFKSRNYAALRFRLTGQAR